MKVKQPGSTYHCLGTVGLPKLRDRVEYISPSLRPHLQFPTFSSPGCSFSSAHFPIDRYPRCTLTGDALLRSGGRGSSALTHACLAPLCADHLLHSQTLPSLNSMAASSVMTVAVTMMVLLAACVKVRNSNSIQGCRTHGMTIASHVPSVLRAPHGGDPFALSLA